LGYALKKSLISKPLVPMQLCAGYRLVARGQEMQGTKWITLFELSIVLLVLATVAMLHRPAPAF
jgi:hypothetical protein